MNSELLEYVKQGITPALIDKLSNYLDESRDATSNGVAAVIPTVLAYFSDYSQTDKGSETIFKAVTDPSLNALFADNEFLNVFGKNRNALIAKGNSFISELFGGKANGLEVEISRYANIKKNSAKGILAGVLPFILNVIGETVKKRDLTESTISSLFDEQKEGIYAAVPSGLATLGSILGLTNFSRELSSVSGTTTKTVRTTNVRPNINTLNEDDLNQENEKKSGTLLKWVLVFLGVVAAAFLIYYFVNKSNEEAENINAITENVKVYTLNNENEVIDETGKTILDGNGNKIVVDGTTIMLNNDDFVVDANENFIIDADGNKINIDKNLAVLTPSMVMGAGEYDSIRKAYIYDVGVEKELTLPDGALLKVGELSSEAKLYDFLSNEDVFVSDDKTQGWITLDRIYFETGSNQLTPDSQKQLENVAIILKNYPNAKAKFGGYTDNAGGQEVNQPLSDARAKAALDQLVQLGVDATRLESEGYGQEHFICPENDTPACMAKNRRVDIRITQK